jgi:hypothetical protein
MSEALVIYLNDHHAGAAAALESLEALQDHHDSPDTRRLAEELIPQIEDDRRVLSELIEKLGEDPESVKSAGAWIGEKFSRLKLRLVGDASLGIFESLETLCLGITGKKLLWTALESVAPQIPALQGLDYDDLRARAVEQFEKVEAERLKVARQIFA